MKESIPAVFLAYDKKHKKAGLNFYVNPGTDKVNGNQYIALEYPMDKRFHEIIITQAPDIHSSRTFVKVLFDGRVIKGLWSPSDNQMSFMEIDAPKSYDNAGIYQGKSKDGPSKFWNPNDQGDFKDLWYTKSITGKTLQIF